MSLLSDAYKTAEALNKAASLDDLETIWSDLNAAEKRHGAIKAAYDYRKACLENPIDDYLGAG